MLYLQYCILKNMLWVVFFFFYTGQVFYVTQSSVHKFLPCLGGLHDKLLITPRSF